MLDNIHMLDADSKKLEKAMNFSNSLKLVGDVDSRAVNEMIMMNVLNCLSFGVMIVNQVCEVGFTNRYADEILEERDGLFLQRNAVKASSSRSTQELQDAVNQASDGPIGARRAISISRPSCLQPLLLFVMPTGSGSAVLCVTDPERKTLIDPALIADLFGLTPAESAVAALVVQGNRISEIAELLSISIHTARCHLKHVFSKTGTERQAELAGYVGSLFGKLNVCEVKATDGECSQPTRPAGMARVAAN